MANQSELVLRPKPLWRWSLTYLALAAAWVIVTADKLEDVAVPVAFITIASWSWLQRLEVVGSELRSHWRLYRQSVDLAALTTVETSSLRRLELGPVTLFVPSFFRTVLVRDESGNSTRFSRGWWQRPYELLKIIDAHLAAGEDHDGEPVWRIQLDEDTQSLLYDAREQAVTS